MQSFISDYQKAYLPGRSIHRSLMLINEVLHKTIAIDCDFLLLKLNTIKAFDFVGLEFLYALLQKVGFGPRFLQVLLATDVFALSAVLLQWRLTEPFQLLRSVRQGCALSPLLYLIVADALSMMLTDVADQGLIKGVPIPEIEDQIIHGQSTDDMCDHRG